MNRKRASATHGPAAGRRLAEKRSGKYVPLSDAGARGRRQTGWHVVWPAAISDGAERPTDAGVYRFAYEGPGAPCPPLE